MENKTKKRGRKPIAADERMSQRVVTFNDQTAYKLSRLGEGNLSLGVRRAAEIAYEKMKGQIEMNEDD
jgi:hypothetical protein